MLIPVEELKEQFVCPVTRRPLSEALDGSFISEDGHYRYALVRGLPVLIDFNRSVLREDDVHGSDDPASVVQRRNYGVIGRIAKRLISPPKTTTKKNVGLLLDEIRRGAIGNSVLVIGGGSIGQGMSSLYDAEDVRIVAFDIYATKNVQLIADGHAIPFSEASFDAVVAQAVLEHVLDPRAVVEEIHRVLKTGGLVYAETPFLQQVHEGPYDFTRFTESGHRYLFKDFDLIRSGPSAGPAVQMLWSVEYLTRSLFRSRTAGKVAKALVFWIRYLDAIIPIRYQVDSASGVYFIGRKNGRTISFDQIIQHYLGADR